MSGETGPPRKEGTHDTHHEVKCLQPSSVVCKPCCDVLLGVFWIWLWVPRGMEGRKASITASDYSLSFKWNVPGDGENAKEICNQDKVHPMR